jgi:formylglycine-generating enzyme required for sulfatase activity
MFARLQAAVLAFACLAAPQSLAQEATPPQTVIIAPAPFEYWPAGEYLRDGRSVPAPVISMYLGKPVEIMKHQVSAPDYAACVAEGACNAPYRGGDNGPGKPVTGVSFTDAAAYAQWLSRKTGENWRLPNDTEWTFAAGEKFGGEAVETVADSTSPAAAWVANYERMARNAGQKDPEVHAHGTFGANGHGVEDMAGNVWEWTSSCYFRTSLDADGRVLAEAENCGVRVIEGRHRSYMTYFIQDAASGGCAVGMTPDHLGFRLVRDELTLRQFLSNALSWMID